MRVVVTFNMRRVEIGDVCGTMPGDVRRIYLEIHSQDEGGNKGNCEQWAEDDEERTKRKKLAGTMKNQFKTKEGCW